MSGTVWSKFFWSDWQADPALRLCSYAARGLWMDMLCIAASHDPIGYVAVAGRGLAETDIARMTGGSESEVAALLGELDRNGVFSRDRKGIIYSRRMVSDARKAAIARKNGKNGGNPTLSKEREISGSVIPPDNPPLKPQEPEAIIQNQDETSLRSVSEREKATASKSRQRRTPEPESFAEFWDVYPRKVSRGKAVQAFASALSRASPDILVAGARRYAEARRNEDPQYTAHASSWLNQDRWLDQEEPKHGTRGSNQIRKGGNHAAHLEALADLARQDDGRSQSVSRPGELALADHSDGWT